MCGICGAITPEPDRAAEAVTRMCLRQRHRGPDDEGRQSLILPCGWTLALGQRRLSIQDLSPAGHQPMVNPPTGDWIVFNGEIYNSPELRQTLRAEGDVFVSTSDTEVILKALARWGRDALDRLRGMFAFTFYDNRGKRLLLARDPLGIKPLFHGWGARGEFLFASEMRALAASGLLPVQLDRAALASALAHGAVQGPLTMLKGVEQLEAGAWIELNLRESPPRLAERGKHWQIPAAGSFRGSRPEAIEQLRARVDRAVQSHMLSDVPVGLFLSAGVDSAAIATVCRRLGLTVEAFTITLDGFGDMNEQPLAREVARQCGLPHHSARIPAGHVADWFDRFAGAMDQPTVDGFNTFLISQAIRERGYKVALSGLGGDELFGGYLHLRQVPRLWRLNRLLGWGGRPLRSAATAWLGRRLPRCQREKLDDLLRAPRDIPAVAWGRRRLFSDSALARLGLHLPELAELDPAWMPRDTESQRGLNPTDIPASVGVLEARYYMANTLLRDSDVFGMAHGLEIRVPWLDREVIDLALSLPGRLRQPQGGVNKPLLVEAAGVPPEVARRVKTGFTLPVAHWLTDGLHEAVPQALEELARAEILEKREIQAVRADFERTPAASEAARLWMLVVLGRWLANFPLGAAAD